MTVSGKIEVFNVSHTGYSIKVSEPNIDGGLRGVSFRPGAERKTIVKFGDVAEQDDLIQYEGVRWNGSWYCTVNISDHGF